VAVDLHTKMYIRLRVPRTERRIRVKFTGHSQLWVLSMELTSCQPSDTDNLAPASGFLKNSGPVVHITQFHTGLHRSTDGDSGICDDMFHFFRIFLIRKQGAPQSLSGHGGAEKISSPPGAELLFVTPTCREVAQ
jgi:hypothetical protein